MPRINLKQAIAAAPAQAALAPEMTFAELADSYSSHIFDGKTDLTLRKWKALFGNRCAWSITGPEIAAGLRAMLDADYSPATVNRNGSAIGSCYRWAKKRHLSPPGFLSPTISLERFEEPVRVVAISPEEVDGMLKGALGFKDRRFAVLVRLLYESGGRRGEVRERVWGDVDLERRQIHLARSKTSVPRILFFSEATATLMARVYTPSARHPEAMLFGGRVPGQPKSYRREWVTLTRAIGRPDLHLHDLRHHRAAELLKAGTTLAVAAQVLGHSSGILQRRYGHLQTGPLEAAAAASWQ